MGVGWNGHGRLTEGGHEYVYLLMRLWIMRGFAKYRCGCNPCGSRRGCLSDLNLVPHFTFIGFDRKGGFRATRTRELSDCLSATVTRGGLSPITFGGVHGIGVNMAFIRRGHDLV